MILITLNDIFDLVIRGLALILAVLGIIYIWIERKKEDKRH